MTTEHHRYYPVYLDLHGRLALVIGGGAVAEERAEGLLRAGARVRVVAAALTPAVAALVADGAVEHVARDWQPRDLDDAFLVFAERIDGPTNQAIFDAAEARGIPVNVQDDTPRCSFIAASLVRRGDLTVAISTAGQAPALAVRLRQDLERRLGNHHARFLELAAGVRAPLLAQVPDFETRKRRWYRLVDSDVLDRLAQGDEHGARQRFTEILGVPPQVEAEATS